VGGAKTKKTPARNEGTITKPESKCGIDPTNGKKNSLTYRKGGRKKKRFSLSGPSSAPLANKTKQIKREKSPAKKGLWEVVGLRLKAKQPSNRKKEKVTTPIKRALEGDGFDLKCPLLNF